MGKKTSAWFSKYLLLCSTSQHGTKSGKLKCKTVFIFMGKLSL